jgi:hypothetical protein
MCRFRLLLVMLMSTFCSALLAQAPASKLFTLLDEKETGISFVNAIEETEQLNVLSYEYFYNGGGVATGDINNDGLLDLYFTANMQPDRLYLNLGGLRFKDISKQSLGKYKSGWKTGVAMADVNADGFLDIYVCHSGSGDRESRRNKLFINNGNLTFTERSKEFGLDDVSYSTQASFFDYDHDGDLDMYLLNHGIKDYKDVELKSLKLAYDSLAADKLYRNDNNFFTDVSQQAGISGNPISFGLGISASDINSDGWIDMYVSNDYHEHDYLYINNQDGTFSEASHTAFGHMSDFSMGNDVADFNNDGLPDIITLDMLPEGNKRQKLLKDQENYELYKSSVANGFHHQLMRNMLHLNNGDGTFSEIGQLAGVSNTDWSWASLFADFDNDGFKDLFITNGYLRDYTNRDFLKYWGNYVVQKATRMEKTYLMDIVSKMPSTKIKNYLFQNDKDLTFTNRADEWGLEQLAMSNGAAYADLDNDGDLEIIINNVNERAFVYRNNSSQQTGTGNFLDVELIGRDRNTRGIGAKVFVYSGGSMQLMEVNPVRGFQSSVTDIQHFGLAEKLRIDSVIVEWPRAGREVRFDVEANQRIKFEEKNSTLKGEAGKQITGPPIFSVEETDIDFEHREFDFIDFKRQPLMPFMFSHTGPVLASADVNGDGLEDLFIGSSKGQPSRIVLQQGNGTFNESVNQLINADRYYTTTDAAFFDADNDGDADLYLTSGMYHDLEPGNALLNDRLYLNDGHGIFNERLFIPTLASGKSCVRPCDFDKDGDVDVFIGGQVIPGQFPKIPSSYLLRNDGTGRFTDVTAQLAEPLQQAGMVSDANWMDVNGDKTKDLIIVGQFMPITIMVQTTNGFQDETENYFDRKYFGFWNTLTITDLDNDGDNDMFVGNLGDNSQIRASEQQPAELYARDFDANGSIDPFFCYYTQGISYPDASRDMALDQIYPLRKKFTSYESYATASIWDIFSEQDLSTATKNIVNTTQTMLFRNVEGKFVRETLPLQAQFAPVTSVCVVDVNNDSYQDLLVLGNRSDFRLKYGKMDANFGTVLMNQAGIGFRYVPQAESGFSITGDVKDSEVLKGSNGKKLLVIGVNGKALSVYKLNSKTNEN